MSAERDAGLAALQNGNAAEAIPYLERAASDTPNDLQTLLPLGAAYGQAGRHADAVRIVMQAVTLQPANAAARYSLAVAYANAGHTEYALTAAQQALQLQPDYPQAQALVRRLSGASGATDTLMGAQPTTQAGAPLSAVQPTQALPGQPASPAYGQPAAPAYGQPTAPTPYGQPTAPYGAPSAPQVGTGSYQGQGAAAYGGSPPSTYYTSPTNPAYAQTPDKFDMKQALTDWVRVLREPNAFFREQAERTGYNGPLSFLVTFGAAVGVCTIVMSLIQLALHPSSFLMVLLQMVFGAVGGITGVLMGAFLWGGVLHLVGRMFGNRQPFEKTFRVAAYSRSPLLFVSMASALISPFFLPPPNFPTGSNTNGSSPFGKVISVQFTEPSVPRGFPGSGTTPSSSTRRANPFETPDIQKALQTYAITGPLLLIGYGWVWALQAIGLQYAQKTSFGSASGTVFVSLLIPLLLFGGFIVLMIALFAGLMGAARGASPGFQGVLPLLSYGSAVWRGL